MKLLFPLRHWASALRLGTWYLLLATIFLAACTPADETLPTALDINVISTNDASTRLAQAANVAATGLAQATIAVDATATRIAEATFNAPSTLPPTWTVAPPPTDSSAPPTPRPQTLAAATGTIYYIFNGDSIALLNADGSFEELILVGGAPADLILSPDEQWLAFTQKVSDSVREVFVISLNIATVPADQLYKPRQVSCLGFANVLSPAWSADNRMLAFAASQAASGVLGIYTADVSGQCPVGNHQRGLVQTQFTSLAGLTWNPANTHIYFASGALYALDAATGTLYPPLTQPSGYGPDSYPTYPPNGNILYYLKSGYDDQTTLVSGVLSQVDTTKLETFPLPEVRGTMLFAQAFHFSRDGRLIIASGIQNASVQNMTVGSAVTVVQNAKFPPQAILSPDAEMVAYIDAGTGLNLVQQIWIVNRRGTNPQQLTTHTEGTISNLNWTAG